MMDKKIHRMIGLLLSILLLFTGTYADAASADPFSAYDLTGKAAICFAPCHSDINDDAICTTESSNAPDIELQPRRSYQQQYREVSESLSLQNSIFGSTSRRKSYFHHAAKALFGQTQNELLAAYIHQSDGKKRI